MEFVNAILNARNVMDPYIITVFLVVFLIIFWILMVVALMYAVTNFMEISLPKNASLVRKLVRVAIILQTAKHVQKINFCKPVINYA